MSACIIRHVRTLQVNGQILQHCHLCLDMFDGKGLISILKIWVYKTFLNVFKTFDQQCSLNILCELFIKYFIMNV